MSHNVQSIYKRINKLLLTIPANQDIKLNEDGPHQTTIFNVMSIEEEWIVDPDLRDDRTLIQLRPNDKY